MCVCVCAVNNDIIFSAIGCVCTVNGSIISKYREFLTDNMLRINKTLINTKA